MKFWRRARRRIAVPGPSGFDASFILLASPGAAESRWVNREVQWWRDNKPAHQLYIVLTSGTLRWDDEHNDWDWAGTTCLPPAARGMFSREPLWADLSSVQTTEVLDRSNPVLLSSVAQIAAPLRGVDKDFLVGEHITYYRRARRQRRGALMALAVLTVVAVAAAVAASIQANNAVHGDRDQGPRPASLRRRTGVSTKQ